MVELELFAYKDADKVLENKGIFQEVKSVLLSVSKVDHTEIQDLFKLWGWSLERYMMKETTWRWDAYKDKVAVSIELSGLIDAVHRDFLRAILAQKHDELDVLVYVTSTFKGPKFENVKRDIEIFKEILTVPIVLVGLTQSLCKHR
ncbi:MAG: hypothetical protein ABSD73_08500 [Candidatus Bathyarchaeia archaeon]|jgi:hypothetical protein